MNTNYDEKQWLEWLAEGRGELYGCFPSEGAGEALAQSESQPVPFVGKSPPSD